jgi:hypothetical protein
MAAPSTTTLPNANVLFTIPLLLKKAIDRVFVSPLRKQGPLAGAAG